MRHDRLGVSLDLDTRAAAGFSTMYRAIMWVKFTKKCIPEDTEFFYVALKPDHEASMRNFYK